MAGGSLTVLVDTFEKLPSVAERILCWVAAANDGNVAVLNSPGGAQFGVRVPEESFGAGALLLKRGGTDLVSGYVAGSHVVAVAANGQSLSQNANTCPASTNQPTTTGSPPVVLNVGGNQRTITLNYANVGGGGTVNIAWGDGTTNVGLPESGATAHTYPDVGTWTIRVEDVSDPTQFAVFAVKI